MERDIPGVSAGRLWPALGLIVISVAVTLGSGTGSSRRSVEAATGQTGGSAGVSEGEVPAASPVPRTAAVALARLGPASGLIAVGVRPGMRVERILVKEGDSVSADQVLAILEGQSTAEPQVALAEAQKQRAEHERSVRKEVLTIERTQADRTRPARLEAARKAAAAAKKRFKEGTDLYGTLGKTLQGKDRYDAEMALFQVEMQAIRSDLDLQLLEAALEAEAQKRRLEDRRLTDTAAEDTILESQIKLARAALRQAEVRAPGPGRIVRIAAHPGEISAGTLLELGDLSSMIATAEVYQTDVPRIRPGDPAEVEILGHRVAGKVARVGTIVGKNQLTSVDPRALRDLRVVEVTIRLDEPEPAARYVNLEVEAVIRPTGEATTSSTSRAAIGLGPR